MSQGESEDELGCLKIEVEDEVWDRIVQYIHHSRPEMLQTEPSHTGPSIELRWRSSDEE
jgi:hypothetical protein